MLLRLSNNTGNMNKLHMKSDATTSIIKHISVVGIYEGKSTESICIFSKYIEYFSTLSL